VARTRRIGADAAIGVVTTASFALGVALLTKFGNKGPAFDALLFGSLNGVSTSKLLLLLGVLVLAVSVFTVLHRAFLFSTFDPEVADVSGIRVKWMDALLMLVLSVSILATLSLIGVTLVAATLVIPAVVARMLSNSFSRMLWISTGLGAAAGAVGMYLSYQLAIPLGDDDRVVNAVPSSPSSCSPVAARCAAPAGLDDHRDAGPPRSPAPRSDGWIAPHDRHPRACPTAIPPPTSRSRTRTARTVALADLRGQHGRALRLPGRRPPPAATRRPATSATA
jgi:hypothetical protein